MPRSVGAPGSLKSLRRLNVSRVLSALRYGPRAQVDLAERTGLSAALVSSIVKELAADGLVEIGPGVRSGRRANVVRLSAKPSSSLVGVSMTREGFETAVWHPEGVELAAKRWPHGSVSSGRELDLVMAAVQEATRGLADIGAIAVSAPGWVSGQVRAGGTVPGVDVQPRMFRDADVGRFAETLGCEVQVRNDANMAALGEARMGAGQDWENFVYVELSSGVGGALVIKGRVFEGERGMAGEIGHFSGSDRGPRCWCGNRGCLETLVGEAALLEPVRRRLSQNAAPTLATLIESALAGEQFAVRTITEAAADIGEVLAQVVRLLNVERVVVGGGLAAAGEMLLRPLTDTLARHASFGLEEFRVVPSELGDLRIIAGCLLVAADTTGLNSQPEFKMAF
ncbi:ROK family transcriptional regulator [Streptomyces sp. OE57]|uniref:ROK family transcriptional regulator n=1 Tax=Streptomyces lacaronensis TaxID=3379885 RepID=UPI0039B7768D